MPGPSSPIAVRRVPEGLDALALARAIAASGLAWFWFDGDTAAPGEPRVSTLGIASEVRRSQPGRERAFLEELRAAQRAPGHAAGMRDAAAPPGFSGGWAIALSYEFGVALLGLEPSSERDVAASPDRAFALRADVVVAIDHATGAAELRGSSAAAIDAWLAEHGGLLRAAADPPAILTTAGPAGTAPRWRTDDHAYAAAVEACRAAIRAGDAYVLCLTDTAEGSLSDAPVELYARLRATGAPIRGGVIDTGDRALVSASPERFLSVRGSRVVTHPIKGTRRRDADPERDRELARELASDPKERAENLMIVDLMRNDLSRVCVPGTVRVERFLEVETHARVHQLVSSVAGTLAHGGDVWAALEAAFPGGSMTGAPKRRAVRLLQEFEGGPRGLYSGCFGWVDAGGDAEIAMTIRSVEIRSRGGAAAVGSARALIGAGGGVTIDSVVSSEVAEKHVKAAALIAALRD